MSGVVRCKKGVRFDALAPGGIRILAALDAAAQEFGDLTVTAGTNDHASGRHVVGEAVDVSVAGLIPAQVVTLHGWLTRKLGALFTVLYEVPRRPDDPTLAAIAYVNAGASGAHLHVQVKKGASFPAV